MKKTDRFEKSLFREMSGSEAFETRGGICILPLALGQKAGGWLIKMFTKDEK